MQVNASDHLIVQFAKESTSNNAQIKLYLNEDYHFTKGVDCQIKECPTCTVRRADSSQKHHFVLDHSPARAGSLNLLCKPKL